ncbi:MAG: endonuclease [Candidatus Tenebribacter davisii]|nr:endonuclease [Candidatus Tenebribacter davisii]
MKYLFIISLLFFSSLYADIPEGYYDGTEGLTGEDLKTALHDIIDNHVEFPYTSTSADTWDILKETDRDPDNPDNVILIYTGWSVDAEQEYNNGQGWSREHVWAKSHGDFGTAPGAGTDVHHLRPCDISVNSSKSNKDFDNGGVEYIDPDGGPTGCYRTTYTWEPREAVKGDVARMIFYMATRYEGDNGEVDLEVVDYAPSAPNHEPVHGVFSTLVEWHVEDPVDEWEENRNDIIYEDYQENRNPFIDHPEFVEMIYNINSAEDPQVSPEFNIISNYPNPFNPITTISFEIQEGESGILTIFNLKGQSIESHEFNAGNYDYTWNADEYGSGLYFYQLKTENNLQAGRMLLLK